MKIKKRNIYLFFVFILFVFSCEKKNDQLYSFYRVYFPSTYMTLSGAVLRTQALPDQLYTTDTGQALTPYSAIIQGQFKSVYDTIIQHGHVWSMTDQNPVINPQDTSNYSRLGPWPTDSSGFFITKINNLYPHTPFYVRSYIVTIHGDTGYNPVIFVDTSLNAVDTWFAAPELPGSIRTGAVGVTYHDPTQDQDIGILAGGSNANELLDDMWFYDPKTRTWTQQASLPYKSTEAVGFVITYTNTQENRVTHFYYGTGETSPYGYRQTNLWYKYDFATNQWAQTISKTTYPLKVSRAVGFSIKNYGYVAFGETDNGAVVTTVYRFDPRQAELADGNPWKLMSALDAQYARKDAIVFVIDSAAYIGLGQKNQTQYFSDLWAFLPSATTSGAWSRKASFPGQARSQAVAFGIGNYGFVGLGANDSYGFKDFYRYDAFANEWTKITDYKIGPDYKGQKQAVRDAIAIRLGKMGFVGTGYKVYDSITPYSKDFWYYQAW